MTTPNCCISVQAKQSCLSVNASRTVYSAWGTQQMFFVYDVSHEYNHRLETGLYGSRNAISHDTVIFATSLLLNPTAIINPTLTLWSRVIVGVAFYNQQYIRIQANSSRPFKETTLTSSPKRKSVAYSYGNKFGKCFESLEKIHPQLRLF